jgi:hypothetical protein
MFKDCSRNSYENIMQKLSLKGNGNRPNLRFIPKYDFAKNKKLNNVSEIFKVKIQLI